MTKSYTVAGYYPENHQRWCGSYVADSPGDAEAAALEENPSVAVVAVFEGEHDCVDTDSDVAFGPEAPQD